MKKITGAQALNLLRKAVSAKGYSFVYVNADGETAGSLDSTGNMVHCHYLHDEDGKLVPGCIIGHAAKALGVPDSILVSEENRTSDSLLQAIERQYKDSEDGEPIYYFTNRAKQVFRVAQSNQDNGKPWGDALTEAKVRYAEMSMIYEEGEF